MMVSNSTVATTFLEFSNLCASSYARELYERTSGPDFPWFFQKIDVTNNNEEGKQYDESERTVGFFHMLYFRGESSPYLQAFLPLMEDLQNRVGEECDFYRARLGLYLKNPKKTHNIPHVDAKDDHYVGLYYLHDAEGDTVLFNETADDKISDGFTINHRSSPEFNKLLLFDGKTYHASSPPSTQPYRIILNLNFTCKKNILEP